MPCLCALLSIQLRGVKMTQKSDLLKHLQNEPYLTVLQAFRLYGVCCLHKRISELRADGHKIGGYMAEEKSRHGKVRVKRHYLVQTRTIPQAKAHLDKVHKGGICR